MKKKVIVACGGAVATSTIAANKVVELCKKNGIDVEICQIRISEIESNLSGAVLIVPTSKVKRDYGIPVISVCIGVKVGKAIRSGLMIGVWRFQLRSSGIMNRRNRCSSRWRSLPRMRCPQAPGILTRMFTQNWSIK